MVGSPFFAAVQSIVITVSLLIEREREKERETTPRLERQERLVVLFLKLGLVPTVIEKEIRVEEKRKKYILKII